MADSTEAFPPLARKPFAKNVCCRRLARCVRPCPLPVSCAAAQHATLVAALMPAPKVTPCRMRPLRIHSAAADINKDVGGSSWRGCVHVIGRKLPTRSVELRCCSSLEAFGLACDCECCSQPQVF